MWLPSDATRVLPQFGLTRRAWKNSAPFAGLFHSSSRAMRATATAVPILYGGSVDAANAAAFTREQDVDGVLVGGASLDREAFQAIIAAVSATVTFR